MKLLELKSVYSEQEQERFYTRSISLGDWDYSAIIKSSVMFGLGQIPVVGKALSTIVGLFWPKNEKDVWQKSLDELREYIDNQILATIQGILNGELREIQKKMEYVARLLEESPGSPEACSEYKNLQFYLVGKDEKFRSFDELTNYKLMPMYASMILLQASYWKMGIDKKDQIGLSSIDLNSLKNHIDDLADSSRNYINRIYETELDRTYENSRPDEVANNMFAVRGYSLLHGVEAVEVVKNIRDLDFDKRFNINVISYSTAVGTITGGMIAQALTPDSEMAQPLCPEVFGQQANRIVQIIGYSGPRINSLFRIGGLEIIYENGDSSLLGERVGNRDVFDLNGSLIKTVEMRYQGLMDEVKFTLFDGGVMQVGQGESYSGYVKYEVEGHYISGVFLSRDRATYPGRTSTASVSFNMVPAIT